MGELSTWATHPWVAERKGRVTFGFFDAPDPDWGAQVALARWAAEVGFDAYWVPDHPALMSRDCWIDLAGLALSTERLRIGVLVSCVLYRNPGVLARLAADVDRLSGGRLVLGLGAGGTATEFARLGLPLPDVAARQQAVAEAAQIILGAWGEEPLTFYGEQYQVDGLHIRPTPRVEARANQRGHCGPGCHGIVWSS